MQAEAEKKKDSPPEVRKKLSERLAFHLFKARALELQYEVAAGLRDEGILYVNLSRIFPIDLLIAI